MTYQVLFSLINDENVFMIIVCCSRDWRLQGKTTALVGVYGFSFLHKNQFSEMFEESTCHWFVFVKILFDLKYLHYREHTNNWNKWVLTDSAKKSDCILSASFDRFTA